MRRGTKGKIERYGDHGSLFLAIAVFLGVLCGEAAWAADKNAPDTGSLITGEGYEKIRFKNVYLSPGGFFESTFIARSANENGDVGSAFGNIPLHGTANSNLSEFRASARHSRISLLAEASVDGSEFSGYFETDFLGAAPTANETESNSFNLRLRQAWANVDFKGGLSLTGGQMWSLITAHRAGLKNRKEFNPLTQDAQYVVGYNWARQMGLRLTKDFNNGLIAGFSLENPETSIGGVVLPSGVQGFNSSANATSPNSLFTLNNTPGANGVSTDVAPDMIGKLVFEPGWGHWEIKGVGRFFRDRLNGTNHDAFGGGVGAAAILPVPLVKNLNFIGEGLVGSGIGRYASGVGPDVIAKANGELKLIDAFQAMTGLEWKPTSAWDVYGYFGLEYYDRTADGDSSIGYGSSFANLSGCATEITGTCQAANKTLWQVQPGFWYRFFQGKEGIAAVGLSYSYTHREIWSGVTADSGNAKTPDADMHMSFVSLRYYIP